MHIFYMGLTNLVKAFESYSFTDSESIICLSAQDLIVKKISYYCFFLYFLYCTAKNIKNKNDCHAVMNILRRHFHHFSIWVQTCECFSVTKIEMRFSKMV